MKFSSAVLILSFFLFLNSWVVASANTHEYFAHCLQSQDSSNNNSVSNVVYTPKNSSYLSILQFTFQNQRFDTPNSGKPIAIVTPTHESHVQASIYCAKLHGLQIRVRSGGHDYEGLSYVSDVPFVIIDLINYRSITIDAQNNTAWVEAGASLGELYYTIAGRTNARGFTAGVCPPVGVGGHISGGGYGMMSRRHGLAADRVIDAKIVDVNGRILDRNTMGEDLFWAIRGGGAASFGVVLAWKIELVDVPEKVTVFTVNRTVEQGAMKLVHRWQYVADKLDENLVLRLFIRFSNSSEGKRTARAEFTALFLGSADTLLSQMQKDFPELGIVEEDCTEMKWIESTLYFAGFQGEPLDILLNRTSSQGISFKGKSDFVKVPIPEDAIKGIWEWFAEADVEGGEVLLSPYGGKLDEVSESSTPFPHRSGNIYNVHYVVAWVEQGREALERHLFWIRKLHKYMAPFVPKSPRPAYFNYRDLDLGVNKIKGNTSYAQASVWGLPYFKGNFKRLVQVKSMVDPGNFFRNEQSIPVVPSWGKKRGGQG